jgi:tripartite motif-containing protein 71
MSDERAVVDEVGRYWDAVAQGDGASKPVLDPTLAATIQRVHGLAATPSAEARERVWQTVLANAEATRRQDEGALPGSLLPNGRALDVPGTGMRERLPSGRQRLFVAQLATAALILLTLIGSFMVFGPGRVSRQEAPPVFIPAIEATPATPESDAGPVAEVVWETRGGPNLPLSYPGYLALDPSGNLWIPDSGNDRYQIFSPDGEFLEVWGESGSGDGQFEFEVELFHSSSIAFAPDGSFYVTDPGNFRVQKFGPDRAFVTSWGEQGAGPGQFDVINGIAVDAQGRVYVTDDGRSDVQVFDGDGAYLRTIGERGFNDGQFMFSMGSAVAIDPAGNVIVSDSSNQRLQTFSPDGELLFILAGGPREDELQQPNQVAIDGEGRLFVASPHLRQVQVFTAEGTYLGAIGTANPTAWADGEIPSGDFLVPTGVTLDGQGNIYVADYEDYRVQKFRLLPPLALAAAEGAAETATPAASASLAELVWESGGGPEFPLAVPGALAIDPDGNLWVTDVSHDRFQIFSPDGEFLEAWGQPGAGDGEFAFEVDMYPAGGIAFAQNGAFYVADAGNHRVQQFAPDRSFVVAWGGEGPGPGQFSRPSAIAVGGDGRVYVTDDERNDVQVFTADGTFLHAIGGRGSGDGQFLFSSGSGIFVDAAGVVWVSDRSNRRIQSFSADGELVSILSEGADGLPLGAPGQPAVDAAGRLFVTIGDLDQMQVFAADGSFLGAMDTLASVQAAKYFGFPGGLALDGDGSVYIADFEYESVAKYRLLPPLAPE